MKGLLLALSMLFLAACADFQTLEELEFAALQSGDWTAVERREKSIARRKANRGYQCPGDTIAICEQRAGANRCSCSSSDRIGEILAGY